jgi:tRNA (adenine57-N1/adenine58-N1)-methyltransferase
VSGPFEAGERVLFVDSRGRTYLVRLQAKGSFHTHGGAVPLDLVIGQAEGVRIESAGGMVLRVFRPRMADFVLKMPRGAQVVYPKDLGTILVYADVFPGARVLEAGTGSGALTIALCRAVGPEGRVVSYDVRGEFQEKAAANVEAFLGVAPSWLELRPGDLREVVGTDELFDRAILDLPDPWILLEALRGSLQPGAVLCAYLPTTVQVQELVLRLPEWGFLHVETSETLLRTWHVAHRSVRPDHRMVAHTGFITIGRRIE